MIWQVPFCEPDVARHARRLLTQLRTGWLGPGDRVRDLETWLSQLVGAPVVATSSGTAALYAAAIVIRPLVKPPIVLVPGYGVRATANAWRAAGWFVRFIDVDPETAMMVQPPDEALERAEAVCCVNFSGRTDRSVPRLAEVCAAASVPLVEDAACALGHRFTDQHAGTFGRFGTLSFSAPKLVTGGQGGAVICRDARDVEMVRAVISNGLVAGAMNLRMTDLQAALILAQLEELDELLARKRRTHDALAAAVPGLYSAPSGPPLHNVLLVGDPARAVTALNARGIEARRQYEAFDPRLPGATRWAGEAVYLPFGNALTNDQIGLMRDALVGLSRGRRAG